MDDSDLFALVHEHGGLRNLRKLPASDLDRFSGRLPDNLLRLWRDEGVGLWGYGRFQFCDPSRYKPIVDLVFAGDRMIDVYRTHIFGYTAFGVLHVWSEQFQDMWINLPLLQAETAATDAGWTPIDADVAIALSLALLKTETGGDWKGDEGEPLFDAVRNAHGALEADEVYGFTPALELGGAARVENTRRVKALEHFALLAGVGPVELVTFEGGTRRVIRALGE